MKRFTLKICLLISAICLIASCATTQKYQQAIQIWQGKKISNLMNVWGYPDSTFKAPNGDEVYVYKQHHRVNFPTYHSGGYTYVKTENDQTVITQMPSTETGGGTYDFNCTTWFEFNKQSIITRVSFRGNGCVAR